MSAPAPAGLVALGEDPASVLALLRGLDLGLFDELAMGPRSAAQLQRRLLLDAEQLTTQLQALVDLGLLERDSEGAAAIYLGSRDAARQLDSRSPSFVGDWLQALRRRQHGAAAD